MKTRSRAILLTTACVMTLCGCGSKEEAPAPAPAAAGAATPAPDVTRVAYEGESVEVGCGKCIYGMEEVQACTVAAVVAGKPVLLEGEGSDAHICSTARRAVVSGTHEGDRFVATKMELESEPEEEGG